MRRCGCDQNDVFSGDDPPVPVDYRYAQQGPAPLGLPNVPRNFRLCHFGVVLERDRRDGFARFRPATDAREGYERADFGPPIAGSRSSQRQLCSSR